MIITKEGCAYKALANLHDWYNTELPRYMELLGCGECSGQKSCKITLAEIIEQHEHYKLELDLS